MHVDGFLYSQIGYDLGSPMWALIRSADAQHVETGSVFEVYRTGDLKPGDTWKTDSMDNSLDDTQPVVSGEVVYWGETWNSHWWEIDFSEIGDPGTYIIVVRDKTGTEKKRSEAIRVGKELVWDETILPVGIEQFEIRARQARNGVGWKDCGAEWRECNSHASAIIGLAQLFSTGFQWIPTDQSDRLRAQIIHGCDYLLILQETGARIGAPDGAFVHELPNHLVVIPGDTAQSVVALSLASRLLFDTHPDRAQAYLESAVRGMDFLLLRAKPYGAMGFSPLNHGTPEDFIVPDEFMTRDLAMMMWGCVELFGAGQTDYQQHGVRLAREVMSRQVPKELAEGGTNGDPLLYGHFYTFASSDLTEKSNVHHGVGIDTGATFPHYIAPLMDMATRWANHPDSCLWRECVREFTEGYLIPACSANPFYLLPVGYFDGVGLMSFCGPWHGFNASIALGSALATACLGTVTGESEEIVRRIMVGNLQWMCGLNAGITQKSFDGCVGWKGSVPDGTAVPFSQIYGVGRRWTGNWTGIPGTIPNGFDVNPQFQLVVQPSKEVDEPLLYTDEDWIPHAGAFVAALAAIRHKRRFPVDGLDTGVEAK